MASKTPKPSLRGENIPFSAMRKFTPLANEAEEKGVKIIKLNIGQPDIETPKSFWDAVKAFPDSEQTLAYAPSVGRPELVNAMVEYYNDVNIPITKNQVVITVGGCEALLIAMMAITDVGDDILCIEPYYSNYSGCAAMAGITINTVTTSGENGYRLPSREEVESKVTENTKAIVYASPGNPTGTVYTEEEVRMLASVCKDKGLFLIGDEVYREFCYNGQTPFSCLQVEDFDAFAIMIDSTSKRYSACGARVGTLLTRNEAVYRASVRLATVRLSAPALDQVAIAACIRDPTIQDYFKRVNEEYQARRDIVFDGLQEIDGVSCKKPDGAFYMIARIHDVDTDDLTRFLISEFQHEGETVMVSPVAGFYRTPGLGVDEIRIAYVLDRAVLKRAMELLKLGIAAYRAQKK